MAANCCLSLKRMAKRTKEINKLVATTLCLSVTRVTSYPCKPYIYTHDLFSRMQRVCLVDCKTVRIFAYSSTRVQSNKRSGTRACEARALRARKTLTSRFTDFFTDFEKKTDCFAVYLLSFKNTLFTRPC